MPIKLVAESAGHSNGDFGGVTTGTSKFTVGGAVQFPNPGQIPGRGVNVAVLSPSGVVEDTKKFDTHANPREARGLASYIENIPKGKIVMVAVKDAAQENMTDSAYDALKMIG